MRKSRTIKGRRIMTKIEIIEAVFMVIGLVILVTILSLGGN